MHIFFKKIIKHKARLKLYQINAITAGTDAQGEVTVRLEEKGLTVQAKGFDTDIVVAAAQAYINALNRLVSAKGINSLHPQKDVVDSMTGI